MDAQAEVQKLIADLMAVIPGSPIIRKLDTAFRHCSAEIATLKGAVASLQYGDSLRAEGSEATYPWDSLKLTKLERRTIIAIASRREGPLSRAGLQAKIYFDRPDTDWPDIKIIDILVCKIRKKALAANADFWIETHWGDGYIFHMGPMPLDKVTAPDGRLIHRVPGPQYGRSKDYQRRKALGLIEPKHKKGEGRWSIADAAKAREAHGIWKPKSQVAA